MVKLTGIFSQLGPKKVLVIGDLLLDTYTIGKARRISPEAPVAVIQVQREEQRPGGAGNVMLNLVSLGTQVVAVGRIGGDHQGKVLLSALEAEGIDTRGIFIQPGLFTPVKNRILADNQQVVRVDHESITALTPQLEKEIIQALHSLLENVSVVAISDYGKGFLSPALLQAVIQMAHKKKIPIITDPKGIEFKKYKGSTVLKPNLSEAYAAAALPLDASLDLVAERVLEQTESEMLMVTRSEAGISLFCKNGERHDFPVKVREIKDVTGAGDTVLAMVACALANELPMTTASQLSNVAAGIAIERFGCARVTLSELASRLLDDDVTNKVFDEHHLFALKMAIQTKKLILLSITSQEGLTTAIFKAIRQLKRDDEHALLVHIRDEEPEQEFIHLLASLKDVDFIILKSERLKSLCEEIAPEEIYSMDGGECIPKHSLIT